MFATRVTGENFLTAKNFPICGYYHAMTRALIYILMSARKHLTGIAVVMTIHTLKLTTITLANKHPLAF